jgi:nucleotide-binding universal stress UspA family protein
MKLLQNILVPVDLEEASLNALRFAGEVAAVYNSRILLMHVINDEQISRETEAMMTDFLTDKFNQLKEILPAPVQKQVDYIFEKGSVFERISRVAIERDVNVIIAGAGNSENDSYPLGTNVEKLMRKNQVPLWVVRKEERFPFRNILCPVDFSDASARALRNAILLSSNGGASLEIMHVFTPINIQSVRLRIDNQKENEALRAARQTQFMKFLEAFDFGNVEYSTYLAEGTPEDEILERIREGNTDLLVMGTTGKTGLSRILMGSVTEKVTREVPVSFITTKSMDLARTYFDSNLREIESFIKYARESQEKGNYEKAIDYYRLGLKQFPDNIPMLIGLKECFEANGDHQQAAYYAEYASEVVRRVWGKEYLDKFGL